jgi:hypothetical protein
VTFLQRRALITQYLDEASLEKFENPAGKLGAVRAILEGGVLAPYEQPDFEALGIIIGDTYVQDMGFHWIVVLDEMGKDYAVQYEDTTLIIFPISMIEKRIRRGENIDVFDLYNGVANEAEILISNGS